MKYIKEEFNLSDKRCKFIARQESMLAKSHFIQEKAISKGFCRFPEMPIVGQIYTSKKM